MSLKNSISSKIYKNWMKETQEEKIKQILKQIKPKGRILDIGCGPGFLEELLENKIFAMDIDKKNIKKCKGIRVIADGNYMPFKDKSFNTVFCIDTIHRFNIEKFPVFMKRLLKPNGILIVSTFCNKYDASQKMNWLKNVLYGFEIEKEFFARTDWEMDAVVVAKK